MLEREPSEEMTQARLGQRVECLALPPGLREVFEQTGYGCAAMETDIGIVHACHASDEDIGRFAGKLVRSQWQLIHMPTAPLIRLELIILDIPLNPYRFESFLNVADPDQLHILANLAHQDDIHLAFFGDGLKYRHTKSIEHNHQQWQQLDEITEMATQYWHSLPDGKRDFDNAKAAYMHLF